MSQKHASFYETEIVQEIQVLLQLGSVFAEYYRQHNSDNTRTQDILELWEKSMDRLHRVLESRLSKKQKVSKSKNPDKPSVTEH